MSADVADHFFPRAAATMSPPASAIAKTKAPTAMLVREARHWNRVTSGIRRPATRAYSSGGNLRVGVRNDLSRLVGDHRRAVFARRAIRTPSDGGERAAKDR